LETVSNNRRRTPEAHSSPAPFAESAISNADTHASHSADRPQKLLCAKHLTTPLPPAALSRPLDRLPRSILRQSAYQQPAPPYFPQKPPRNPTHPARFDFFACPSPHGWHCARMKRIGPWFTQKRPHVRVGIFVSAGNYRKHRDPPPAQENRTIGFAARSCDYRLPIPPLVPPPWMMIASGLGPVP